MKLVRSLILALALSTAATAAFALGSRDSSAASSSCFSADYCFCIEIGCGQGAQLCASAPTFTCYQR